jgi:hypothetical protein
MEFIKLTHTEIETLISLLSEMEDLSLDEQEVLIKLKRIREGQKAKLGRTKKKEPETKSTFVSYP